MLPRSILFRGLTLPEVLIVLALLVILTILFLPPFYRPGPSERRQLAATVLRNVVNACNSYKQDYGHYPQIEAAKDGSHPFISFGDLSNGHCKVSNSALLDVLRAIDRGENKDHALNPKKIKYYEGPKAIDAKNPRRGFVDGPEFPSSLQGCLMDPWGTQYCFILETDKDETLDLSSFYSDLAGPTGRIRFPAVGLCLGKDGHLGGPGYEGQYHKSGITDAPDDIVSWQ